MTQFEVASNRRLRQISGHVRNEGPSAAATAADDANDGVVVAGAGLVGCFMAYVLARRGFNVTLVEKWPDMRSNVIPGGRSINLVLTHRGLCGLDAEGLHDAVRALCVPAKVRVATAALLYPWVVFVRTCLTLCAPAPPPSCCTGSHDALRGR